MIVSVCLCTRERERERECRIRRLGKWRMWSTLRASMAFPRSFSARFVAALLRYHSFNAHALPLSLWSLLSLFFFSCIVFCAYFINFSCSWILVFDWFCVVFEDLCTATHQEFVSMLNLSMYYGAWLISLTFFFLMNGTDSFLCNYVLFILLRDYSVIVLWLMYLMRYCMWFYDFYFLFL